VLVVCTQHDFAVSRLRVQRASSPTPLPEGADLNRRMHDDALLVQPEEPPEKHDGGLERQTATVVLEVQGSRSVSKLAARLADIPGVVSVNAGDENVPSD
jgi:hypothetical protein